MSGAAWPGVGFLFEGDDRPTGEKSANARDDQMPKHSPPGLACVQQNNGGRKCQSKARVAMEWRSWRRSSGSGRVIASGKRHHRLEQPLQR